MVFRYGLAPILLNHLSRTRRDQIDTLVWFRIPRVQIFFYNVPARPVMPQRFYAVAVRLNKSKMIEISDFKTKSSTAAAGTEFHAPETHSEFLG